MSRERRDEQKPDRPAAENQDLDRAERAVFFELAGVDAVQHAGERLGERGALERKAFGNAVDVALDEAPRHQQVFGEGAVQIMQVLAEVFAAAPARLALQARRGIGDDDGVADRIVAHARADRGDASRHLVAEERRRLQHARMPAAPENLHVGAAGGRRLDLQEDLAFAGLRDRHVADLDLFRAEEHRALHRLRKAHRHVPIRATA